jgi:hypothetical protein
MSLGHSFIGHRRLWSAGFAGKVAWVLVLFGLFATCLALDHFVTGKGAVVHLSLGHPFLERRGGAPEFGNPVVFPTETRKAKSLTIELNCLATDDYYDNFLQTSDGEQAIRLELQHPNQLYLALGDASFVLLSSSFQLNTWHQVAVHGEAGQFIQAFIDGKQVYATSEKALTRMDYRFDRVALGTGYTQQRSLQGAISAFHLSADLQTQPPSWYYAILPPVLVLLALAMLWWASVLWRSALTARIPFTTPPILPLGSDLKMLGLVAGLAATGLYFGSGPFAPGKWTVLGAVGLAFLLVPVVVCSRLRDFAVTTGLGWLLWLGVLVSLVGLIGFAFRDRPIDLVLALVPATVALGGVWFLHRSEALGWGMGAPTWRPTAVTLGGFLALGAATLYALGSAQNWQQIMHSFGDRPASTILYLCLGASLGLWSCWFLAGRREDCRTPTCGFWISGLRICFSAFPYLVFLILALRADPLFIEGAQMHWEYYVGPIRMLRQGGWLLWDVPSQYGFLVILMPSLLPVSSAWDAFYLFQALTLFVSVGLFYHALHRLLGAGRFLSFFLVIASFFLAYPTLCGPTPFPSSSAVRFLWCYVLLYLAVVFLLPSRPSLEGFVRWGSLPWVAGVLWSAESAVYVTATFAAPLGLHLLVQGLTKGPAAFADRQLLWCLARPLVTLATAILLTFVYYGACLGHFPDLRMYALHASSYASGFGAVPLAVNGPIWVFILVLFCGLCGLGSTLARHRQAAGPAGAIAAATACVWAVASYYVGRAVPNNLVAVFPLLIFALAIVVRATMAASSLRLGPLAVAISLFAVALTSPLANPGLVDTLAKLRFTPGQITSRLAVADESLSGILVLANIGPDTPVVYHGYAIAMPADPSEQSSRSHECNWLPTPLALLEMPVDPVRRAEIITRYIERHRQSGFFVQRLGQFEERLNEWLELLSQTHEAQAAYANEQYRVIYFKYRDDAP